MFKFKFLFSIVLAFILLTIPVLAVSAQTEEVPTEEPTPVTSLIGMVESIILTTDPVTTISTVDISLLVDTQSQLITLTLDQAVTLGLITVSADVPPVISVVDTMIGQTITVDASMLPPAPTEEVDNPIAKILGDFFSKLFGVDASAIQTYHDEGMGYGEIAQAGFLSYALGGDGTMMETFIDAKQSGDYSAITLPDGSTPENWGQLKKSVMSDDKAWKNLGGIVSGRADENLSASTTENSTQDPKTGKPDKPVKVNPGKHGGKKK
jgi:hypothetical protein